MGYSAIAITDHADSSNMDFIIPRIIQVANDLNKYSKTRLIPGIELTHLPIELFAELTARARKLGAKVVVAHGETVVEPVRPGTNRAAIAAGVDILSHPGFITPEDAALAAEKGVFLEITGRKGHSLTNGHVAKMATVAGALMAVNADAHGPGDFLTAEMAETVARGAGLSADQYAKIRSDMGELVSRLS